MTTKVIRYMIVLYPEATAANFGLDAEGKFVNALPIHSSVYGYSWYRLDTDYILALAEHALSSRPELDQNPDVLVLPHAGSEQTLAAYAAGKNKSAFFDALSGAYSRATVKVAGDGLSTMSDVLDYLEANNPMPTMAPVR